MKSRATPLGFAAAALVLGLWTGQAWADVERCSTPRKAIEGLLHWQQPGEVDLEKAAACLDLSLEESSAVAPLRARQIKEVLDGNGLFVKVEEVPGDADYQDEAGRSRYVPFPRRLPRVWVEKVGDRWLWSASTVSAIPELHRETFAFDAGAFEQRLPEWARGRFLGVEAWKLLGLLALILVAVILRAVVMYLVASQARSFMARIRAEWGRTLLARIDNPIGTLVAVGLVAILLPALQLPVRMTMVSLLAVRVLAAFSAVWAVYRLVDVASGWLEQKAAVSETKLDDQLVPLVRTALKVFIVAIGIVFVLQNLSVDVAGLVAGLGLGGLAVALAARETVANLFGAVTVFLDKPFQIGDWIVLDGNHGVVEQVGFRSTRLRTFYNSVLTVPNATLAAGLVDNYGARQYRRVSTTLGLTYDTRPEQMQAFVEGIRAIIQANPCTRKDFYEVHFNDFGSHSLNVMVYFFLKVDKWSEELRERHNIMLEILRLAEELRVSFAFPTTTLNFESLPAPGTMRQPRRGPENMAEVVQAFGPGGAKARPGGPRLTHGFLPSSEKASTVAAHSGGVPGSAAAAVGAQIAEEDD